MSSSRADTSVLGWLRKLHKLTAVISSVHIVCIRFWGENCKLRSNPDRIIFTILPFEPLVNACCLNNCTIWHSGELLSLYLSYCCCYSSFHPWNRKEKDQKEEKTIISKSLFRSCAVNRGRTQERTFWNSKHLSTLARYNYTSKL